MLPDEDVWNLLSLCDLRLKYNPRDPDALFAKAAVLARVGRYSEALRYLDRLMEECRDYPGLNRFRARILLEESRPRLATVWVGVNDEMP